MSKVYQASGVDIKASESLVKDISKIASEKTSRPGAIFDFKLFASLFDISKAGYKDPLLVATADGIGTKMKIVTEMGDYYSAGIDLVAMNVNDLVTRGAEPLFFLDYYSTSFLERGPSRILMEGIADACKESGCALIGGETAEMPNIYNNGEFDLSGFAVGAVERGKQLPRDDIEEGDVVIALQSSGLHCNGFSLINDIIKKNKFDLFKKSSFSDNFLGIELLTPTKIYVKPILNVIKKTNAIKAIANITGGGLLNIKRILPKGLDATLYLDQFKPQPIYDWIADYNDETYVHELMMIFNYGVGMIVVVPKKKMNDVLSVFNQEEECSYFVGEITKSISYHGGGRIPEPKVLIEHRDYSSLSHE